MHKSFGERVPWWFSQWLGTASVPYNYPNQCWLIFIRTIWDKFQRFFFIKVQDISFKRHLKMSFAKCRPLCFVLQFKTWMINTLIFEKNASWIVHFFSEPTHLKMSMSVLRNPTVKSRKTNVQMFGKLLSMHYGDVIMGVLASQLTSLTIAYSTVYSGADQRKHQSSATLAFVRRIHRSPVNSPYKGPVTRKIFPFHDVIMILRNNF